MVKHLDLQQDYKYSFCIDSGGSVGGAPLRPKIFSISCSFLEHLAKSHVGVLRGLAPLLRGILDPPLIDVVIQIIYINF